MMEPTGGYKVICGCVQGGPFDGTEKGPLDGTEMGCLILYIN